MTININSRKNSVKRGMILVRKGNVNIMRLNIYFKRMSINLFRYMPEYHSYYGTIAAVVNGTT